MIKLKKDLEESWLRLVRSTVRWPRGKEDPAPTDLAAFAVAVSPHYRRSLATMWEQYTVSRSTLPRRLLSERKNVATYLLGFHLPNAARMTSLLDRLSFRHKFRDFFRNVDHEVRFVDVGCGTGALAQTWAAEFGMGDVRGGRDRYLLLDSWDATLDVAKQGLLELGLKSDQIRVSRGHLENELTKALEFAGDKKTIYVVALGYVLNEISRNNTASRQLLQFLEHLVQKNVPLLILSIDPANQPIARSNMEWRDKLVQMELSALYPCPHQLACPMLDRSRDWCYSDDTWSVSHTQKKIDDLIGLDHTKLSSSAMAFASQALLDMLRATERKPTVVGKPVIKARPSRNDPPKVPQGAAFLLCMPDGKLKNWAAPEALFGKVLRGTQFVPFEHVATEDAQPRSPVKGKRENPSKGSFEKVRDKKGQGPKKFSRDPKGQR